MISFQILSTFLVCFCKFNSFRHVFKSNVLKQRKNWWLNKKNQTENVFFSKNVFDNNQKHLQVFQVFRLLKNTKKHVVKHKKPN